MLLVMDWDRTRQGEGVCRVRKEGGINSQKISRNHWTAFDL